MFSPLLGFSVLPLVAIVALVLAFLGFLVVSVAVTFGPFVLLTLAALWIASRPRRAAR